MRLYPTLLPALAVGASLFLAACTAVPPSETPRPVEPLARAEKTLLPAGYESMPGWQEDDLSEAWPAFLNSCRVLGKKEDWREICRLAKEHPVMASADARRFFETHMQPSRVVLSDGTEAGMSTGYYEPLLRGSRKASGRYRTPLYGVPDDLVVVDLAGVYPQLKGMRLRGRLKGNRLVAYESRGEIRKTGKLAGQEIVWTDDAVDAFFLQVQGSGRVYLEESGETIRLAYAEQNGHPYRSIGRYLVDLGEMKLEEASAQRIRQWISENPSRFHEVLDANPSYVFFREERIDDPRIGPKGALGVPLTARRSVAIDPAHLPLGAPLFIDTTEPNSDVPLQKLVMAQDTGGAIKGVLRMDYFWGFGNAAGELAGRMKQPVRIWVLLPKQEKADSSPGNG